MSAKEAYSREESRHGDHEGKYREGSKGKYESKEKRGGQSEERQLAGQIADIIGGSIDKVKPITQMITRQVEMAESVKKQGGNLDEQDLVQNVRPLIEQATQILNETHGAIKALDPSGRISQKAQGAAQSHEASPEEYYLAQKLTDLTENVQKVVDKAKMSIQDMPHAKQELIPLLDLLQNPLAEIIGAVGMLLSGVLGLVRNLLEGLGLGGLLDNLLGSLGLEKLLGNVTNVLGDSLKSLFPTNKT